MPKAEPQIIHEDTHLIVLSKPAGLLSQGDSSQDPNLVDWLRVYLGRNYVGLIHRLDRNTSGIMLIGKRSKSAERLTRSLIEGRVERTYLGWVEGTLREAVRWRHLLVKDHEQNLVKVVRADESSPGKSSKDAQEALLSATPQRHAQWRGRPVTLVEYRLETGRSHQIRVQSSAEGFPLLGDRKYAPKAASIDFPRPALHSHRLVFPHPMSEEILRFEAPLPADLAQVGAD